MKRLFLYIQWIFIWFLLSIAVSLPVVAIDESTASQDGGSIVVIRDDYNVEVFDLNVEERFMLTTDGSMNRRYQWPTWSTDGRLAYFCCDLRFANDFETQAYISSDGRVAGDIVFSEEAQPIIYAAWSPENCASGTNCRDLALLVNNVRSGVLSVNIIRQTDASVDVHTAGEGSPFYYHWGSEGKQLIFHRNNSQIAIYDVSEREIIRSFNDVVPGFFQTPVWSPTGDGFLFSASNTDQTNSLVLYDGDIARELVPDVEGLISFLWSPDSRYIAYRTVTDQEISTLTVLDVNTGATIEESAVPDVVSFFWSPDSSKIAYISLTSEQTFTKTANRSLIQYPVQNNRRPFVWRVLDIESGEDTRYSSFAPTYEMGYFMQYFDQFAPSHRIWSPDSQSIVYSAVERDEPVILVQDISAADETLQLGSGVFGVWSFK